MNTIKNLANAEGFRGVYLLKPAPYQHYLERQSAGTLHENGAALCADPMEQYPWMNAMLLLLMPYQPYLPTAGVSGYYVASNHSYHARNNLISQLNALGIRSDRISVPIRETLLRHGIGIACKNGLTAVPPFGTRFIAQTIAVCVADSLLCERLEAFDRLEYDTCPSGCDRCIKACPSHAIQNDGMNYRFCVRADMEGGLMQPQTMEHMHALLGCEVCQSVCPLNWKIAFQSEVPDAFDLERLLLDEKKPALDLIGKNMNPGGRLLQHALIMSANTGRTDLLPLIEKHLSDSRPHIVQAAEYAFSVLRNM